MSGACGREAERAVWERATQRSVDKKRSGVEEVEVWRWYGWGWVDEKENRAEDHTGDGVEDKDRKVEKARGEQPWKQNRNKG